MRILQISDTYPPAPGGLERVVAALAAGLVTRGHESHVATLAAAGLPDEVEEAGVLVHRLRGLTHHLERFSEGQHLLHPTAPDPVLVRRLQELVDTVRPDVVHVHGWILASVLVTDLRGAGLVVTLHDHGLECVRKTLLLHDRLDEVCPGPALARCLSCASGFYGAAKATVLTVGLREGWRRLDRVDRFVAISDLVARSAAAIVPPGTLEVIPPFADVAAEPAQVPLPSWVPSESFVLFAGALSDHKGLGLVREAHTRMATDVPLVVVGHGATAGLADDAGARRVIAPGSVDAQTLSALYDAATIVAVPSRWPEPFGLVAVEAMAHGVPVVVGRTGAQPEVVGDAGVSVGSDPAELATVLDSLLADPERRAEMGRLGRRRAQDFTADAILPRYEAVYADVSAGRDGVSAAGRRVRHYA